MSRVRRKDLGRLYGTAFQELPCAEDQLHSLHVATQRLPFVLLPPGTWDIQQVVEHYRKVSKSLPAGLSGRKVDWSRLKEIATLKPARCYIGEKSWLGYVVFEFEYSKRVVLECPIEGNATYILSCHWKAMVGYTKAELRHQYSNSYTKVVHKGEWLYRARQALRAS
jgi:hypothetical protein